MKLKWILLHRASTQIPNFQIQNNNRQETGKYVS